MTASRLLDCLADRVLVWDGAMGTQIHAADLTPADYALPEEFQIHNPSGVATDGCHELLNLTRPDVIQAIHERYLEAGADLIETNTFGNTSVVLAEFGIPGMDFILAKAAAEVARKAADRCSTPEKPRFVVGALGPGTKLVSLGQTTFDEIEKTYGDSFLGTLEGGADALLIETAQDLLMVKAAIVGACRAMAEAGRSVPLFVQVTMEQTGTMLLGTEIAASLNMAECFPEVCAFGINCATGPVEMGEHVRFLSQNSTRPITVQPNAGLPVMERGQGVYKLSPDELAHHHERFHRDFGLAMAGGCCGTTPAHIRAVAEALGGRSHQADAHWIRCRPHFPGFDFSLADPSQGGSAADRHAGQCDAFQLKGCSSLYLFQPYRQDTSFLIVGEKTNANGSRQFRDMLSAENWEGLTELARELEGEGSHVLDVCTAFVGRDENADMKELLSRYNRHIQVPLMIDSTEAPVIESALRTVAGKPIVNSINFEDGGARTERVLGLCRRYGAAVVALTIDEEGMAKSAERKVEIADRLLAATRRHGLPDHDVFIDCLTFTLGSGDEEFRNAGVETIEAIRSLHRRYPRVNSILGVSNASFGLKPAARLILNSTFLHFALEAGLTSAIVHFSKILPENKIDPDTWQIASDLVFDRRAYATAP